MTDPILRQQGEETCDLIEMSYRILLMPNTKDSRRDFVDATLWGFRLDEF